MLNKKNIALLIIFLNILTVFQTNAYLNSELESANFLAGKWFINDNSRNPSNYNLDKNVLRQEIAKVAVKIAWLTPKSTCENKFNDVSKTNPNDWACPYIEALLNAWIISKNTNFNPTKEISKTEALKIMLKATGKEYKSSSTNWQSEVVKFAFTAWITSNFTDYDAKANRWWIFEIWNNSINNQNPIKIDNIDDIDSILEEINRIDKGL